MGGGDRKCVFKGRAPSGAPDRKPFGWETGAPQTGCFDNLGIRESVPGGPPEPFVTIQLTIVDVLGCWE